MNAEDLKSKVSNVDRKKLGAYQVNSQYGFKNPASRKQNQKWGIYVEN